MSLDGPVGIFDRRQQARAREEVVHESERIGDRAEIAVEADMLFAVVTGFLEHLNLGPSGTGRSIAWRRPR